MTTTTFQNPFLPFFDMWIEQYASFERAAVARSQAAVATWSSMTQDAIAYSAQLAAEARKLTAESLRRVGQVG